MTTAQIHGEDVIGIPSQNLTHTELRVLVGYAEGLAPSAIATSISAGSAALRSIEANIRAKLGARTQPHMIARAFTLGVLIPRALCLLLAAINALEGTHDALRTRNTRRSRSTPSIHLVMRRAAPAASGRNAPVIASHTGQLVAASFS